MVKAYTGWIEPKAIAEWLPTRPCFHSEALSERRHGKEGGAWDLSSGGAVVSGSGDFGKTEGLDLAELGLPALLLGKEEIVRSGFCTCSSKPNCSFASFA